MFKNGITLLVIAAAAALVSTEAAQDKSHTIPHHPVVKKVTRAHGKISLTLEDGSVIHTKEHVHATKVNNVHNEAKKAKNLHTKSAEGVVNGETIRKYAHGVVKIAAKNQLAQPVRHHKKAVQNTARTHGKDNVDPVEGDEDAEVEAEDPVEGADVEVEDPMEDADVEVEDPVEGADVEDSVEEEEGADVELESGETVSLTFGSHNVSLTLLQNGTLKLEADEKVEYLPAADDVTIEFDGSAEFETSEDEVEVADEVQNEVQHKKVADSKKVINKDVGIVEGFENKVTEFVTKMSGDGDFTKKSAPYIVGCGLIGALAVVVGIAAVAVGRARDSAAAAADPQSVLAEDIEAGTPATATEDAAADQSESLSDSDSEVDDAEEGKFANELVVSV